MKEYQFQYTTLGDTLFVILGCILVWFAFTFAGFYFGLQEFIIIILAPAFAILLFQKVKRKIIRSCIAKLRETSVEFYFTNETKLINFSDLISFKDYNGLHGPILYLKTQSENFKIFANNNYCKTEDFKIFSDDVIIQLDKYKDKNNSTLIHEGSMYATKGFLHFLIIATSIYLLSLIIESKELRPYIGFGGGIYLLISWIAYFNKRDLKSK